MSLADSFTRITWGIISSVTSSLRTQLAGCKRQALSVASSLAAGDWPRSHATVLARLCPTSPEGQQSTLSRKSTRKPKDSWDLSSVAEGLPLGCSFAALDIAQSTTGFFSSAPPANFPPPQALLQRQRLRGPVVSSTDHCADHGMMSSRVRIWTDFIYLNHKCSLTNDIYPTVGIRSTSSRGSRKLPFER